MTTGVAACLPFNTAVDGSRDWSLLQRQSGGLSIQGCVLVKSLLENAKDSARSCSSGKPGANERFFLRDCPPLGYWLVVGETVLYLGHII